MIPNNFFSEIYKGVELKPKASYRDLLLAFYPIHEANKPYTVGECKLAFLAFLESKLFACECGQKFPTIQARNGHKKKCKL